MKRSPTTTLLLALPTILTVFLLSTLVPRPALAATAGPPMPWNTPLENLMQNLTGPTAAILAVIMFAIGGIVWGFMSHERGASRVGQAIMAVAILFGAAQIVTALGFVGATL